MDTKKIIIASREDADKCLRTIAALKRFIETEENLTGQEIAEARADLLRKTGAKREALAAEEAALKEWAEAHKVELFAEPRSIDLNWGRVGFRWTPWSIKFLNKLKVETIIERLRAHKLAHLIHVKESVDKDKALNYDNETLEKVGMRKVHHDEFFYEVKREEIK